MVDISVIFVNYNTCKLTLDAINSVYNCTTSVNFEIILVDNNSNDNSIEMISSTFPEVKIIKNNKNLGFGQANNIGMKIAKGKYFFLLNTDTYLINNAIEIFFEFMESPKNKNVVIVGGTLIMPNGDWNVSYGYFPNYKTFIKGTFWRHFFSKKFYVNSDFKPIQEYSNKPFYVDYVSGADTFIRSEIIKKVGGFNKSFFMYFEETELTFRIKRLIKNAKVCIIPDAKIVHISQGSIENGSKSLRFKFLYLKSKSNYFRIQDGYIAAILIYIRGLIKIIFNR